MATIPLSFANYACELLSTVGHCTAKRMFGGWGISVDGKTMAILANLGSGDTLWLKASDSSRPQFEAAGCTRFSYPAKGVMRSMNYYSAPEAAMDSPHDMQPWARLAWEAALMSESKSAPRKRKKRPTERR